MQESAFEELLSQDSVKIAIAIVIVLFVIIVAIIINAAKSSKKKKDLEKTQILYKDQFEKASKERLMHTTSLSRSEILKESKKEVDNVETKESDKVDDKTAKINKDAIMKKAKLETKKSSDIVGKKINLDESKVHENLTNEVIKETNKDTKKTEEEKDLYSAEYVPKNIPESYITSKENKNVEEKAPVADKTAEVKDVKKVEQKKSVDLFTPKEEKVETVESNQLDEVKENKASDLFTIKHDAVSTEDLLESKSQTNEEKPQPVNLFEEAPTTEKEIDLFLIESGSSSELKLGNDFLFNIPGSSYETKKDLFATNYKEESQIDESMLKKNRLFSEDTEVKNTLEAGANLVKVFDDAISTTDVNPDGVKVFNDLVPVADNNLENEDVDDSLTEDDFNFNETSETSESNENSVFDKELDLDFETKQVEIISSVYMTSEIAEEINEYQGLEDNPDENEITFTNEFVEEDVIEENIQNNATFDNSVAIEEPVIETEVVIEEENTNVFGGDYKEEFSDLIDSSINKAKVNVVTEVIIDEPEKDIVISEPTFEESEELVENASVVEEVGEEILDEISVENDSLSDVDSIFESILVDRNTIDLESQIDNYASYEAEMDLNFDMIDNDYDYNYNKVDVMDNVISDIFIDNKLESPEHRLSKEDSIRFVYQYALLSDVIDNTADDVSDLDINQSIIDSKFNIEEIAKNIIKTSKINKYESVSEEFEDDEYVLDGKEIDDELLSLSNQVIAHNPDEKDDVPLETLEFIEEENVEDHLDEIEFDNSEIILEDEEEEIEEVPEFNNFADQNDDFDDDDEYEEESEEEDFLQILRNFSK